MNLDQLLLRALDAPLVSGTLAAVICLAFVILSFALAQGRKNKSASANKPGSEYGRTAPNVLASAAQDRSVTDQRNANASAGASISDVANLLGQAGPVARLLAEYLMGATRFNANTIDIKPSPVSAERALVKFTTLLEDNITLSIEGLDGTGVRLLAQHRKLRFLTDREYENQIGDLLVDFHGTHLDLVPVENDMLLTLISFISIDIGDQEITEEATREFNSEMDDRIKDFVKTCSKFFQSLRADAFKPPAEETSAWDHSHTPLDRTSLQFYEAATSSYTLPGGFSTEFEATVLCNWLFRDFDASTRDLIVEKSQASESGCFVQFDLPAKNHDATGVALQISVVAMDGADIRFCALYEKHLIDRGYEAALQVLIDDESLKTLHLDIEHDPTTKRSLVRLWSPVSLAGFPNKHLSEGDAVYLRQYLNEALAYFEEEAARFFASLPDAPFQSDLDSTPATIKET